MTEPSKVDPPVALADGGAEQPRMRLHMPVDVRSASLAFIALAVAIALLRFTQEFIVPVLLGVVLSYALTPLVDQLQKLRLPRMAGAAVILGLILSVLVSGSYLLRGQAGALVSALPAAARQLRELAAGKAGDGEGTLSSVQRAANELQAAGQKSGEPPAAASAPASAGSGVASSPAATAAAKPATPVVMEKKVDVRDYVLTGTLGLASFAGQALVVVFVALFLLGSGNSFRKKIVLMAGPTLTQRRVTVQALDEVHSQIQRYLLVQLVTSLLVGVATWLAFWAIGLNDSAVWGVVAAVANLIPYVGSIAVSGAAAAVGLVQFKALGPGLMLAGASFVVHLIVGNLVTPWLTGKTSRMSPFVVFVGVLFFGWLWGVAGLILAFPLMVGVKIVCDRVDDLKPIGELLGE